MSIPKDPRQLMINLMYLVLTALLALNVSAEVMNAFFSLDNSINSTNSILKSANDKVIESMQKTVEERTQYKPLVEAAVEAQTLTSEFNTYVDELLTGLEEEAGGLYPEDFKDPLRAGRPLKYKDKEIPTRFFVDGQNTPNNIQEPKGPELKEKIITTRDKLLGIVERVSKLEIEGTQIKSEEVEELKSKIALTVDDETWKLANKASWEQYTFGYMPVAACYPILRKFQNDAKNAESTIINFLSSKIGATIIEFDQFFPVLSANKSYIIRGDTYQADVFLSAFSTQASEGISMRVNGSNVKIENGIGKYVVRPESIGEKDVKVDITVVNPFTGKQETYTKNFKYEVGERSVAVSPDKMNVFYVGVDNPISVSAAGISSNQLKVTISGAGGSIEKVGSNNFVVRVSRLGEECKVNVVGGGLQDSKSFRVKRIPDPIARLGALKDSRVGNGEFKAQPGVIAYLDDFDFDARCEIQGYSFTYQPARQDPVTVVNDRGAYNAESIRLVNLAKPGDTYYFDNVKARCPGDPAGRTINSLVYKIR